MAIIHAQQTAPADRVLALLALRPLSAGVGQTEVDGERSLVFAVVMMPTEDIKAIVRRFYTTVVAAGQLSTIDSLVGAGYVDHNAGADAGRGPHVVRNHLDAIRSTFPDFRLTIEEMIAEGDLVATRVTGRGTHLGEWVGIRPTGRVVQLRGINQDRVVGGRIVEHWGEADTVGMLVQMDVDPFGSRRGDRGA